MPVIPNVITDTLKAQPNSIRRGSDLRRNFGKEFEVKKAGPPVKLAEPENIKPRRDVVSFWIYQDKEYTSSFTPTRSFYSTEYAPLMTKAEEVLSQISGSMGPDRDGFLARQDPYSDILDMGYFGRLVLRFWISKDMKRHFLQTYTHEGRIKHEYIEHFGFQVLGDTFMVELPESDQVHVIELKHLPQCVNPDYLTEAFRGAGFNVVKVEEPQAVRNFTHPTTTRVHLAMSRAEKLPEAFVLPAGGKEYPLKVTYLYSYPQDEAYGVKPMGGDAGEEAGSITESSDTE